VQVLCGLKDMRSKSFGKMYSCILLGVLFISDFSLASMIHEEYDYLTNFSPDIFTEAEKATTAKKTLALGNQCLKRGKNNEALVYFKSAAVMGEEVNAIEAVEANLRVSWCYKNGVGIDVDLDRADEYAKKADNCRMKSDTKINLDELLVSYGNSPGNWGDLPIFGGGYINYGYWKNIKDEEKKKKADEADENVLTLEDRILSGKDLYREIIKKRLNVRRDDIVLEVGCGRGAGIYDFFCHDCDSEFRKVIGIDMNPEQIECSKSRIGEREKIRLLCGNAESIPLKNGSVDKIYSVEIVQHFSPYIMSQFAKQVKRLLRKGGKLVFTSYFLVNNEVELEHKAELDALFPCRKKGLEYHFSPEEIERYFVAAGFEKDKISYVSIGEDVFWGFDKWAKQHKDKEDFTSSFYKAYQAKYIDYYIFTIQK